MDIAKKQTYVVGSLLSSVALGLFLIMTNPDKVAVGLLVVPVILLFLLSFCVAQIFLIGTGFIGAKPRKQRIVSLVGASFATIIMILESTGGISLADVILLALILIVVAVYIDKF